MRYGILKRGKKEKMGFKKILMVMLLFSLPFLMVTFNVMVVDKMNTELHEGIHSSICNEFYNGTAEITYLGVFGKGGVAAYTACYNRSVYSGEVYLAGRMLDNMNEIYAYNLSSQTAYLNLITFLITLLICVILYISKDD